MSTNKSESTAAAAESSARSSSGSGAISDAFVATDAASTKDGNPNININSNSNAPGGLLDYFVSRKRTALVNNNNVPLVSDIGAVGTTTNNANPISRGSFYRSMESLLGDLRDNDRVKPNVGNSMEEPSSWMDQAWQTVDSAKEWMLAASPMDDISNKHKVEASSSDDQRSNWTATMLPPSLSAAVSNTYESISSLSIFSDGDAADQTAARSDATKSSSPPKSAFLPSFASRFEWATNQRNNPYQAVIGRDVDRLLHSPSLFSSFSAWWLPWIVASPDDRDRRSLSIDVGGERGGGGDAAAAGEGRRNDDARGAWSWSWGRKEKSRPSEASVRAVENLLFVVQRHLAEAAERERISEESRASRHRQIEGIDNLEHSEPSRREQQSQWRGESSEGPPPVPETGSGPMPSSSPTPSKSPFPSTASSQSSTPSTATIPKKTEGLPPIRSADGNNSDLDDGERDYRAMHAEMAARLAEGTLRAYRDLALDEATELHSALHHWTVRWERPFLGWLEAGPDVWFSEEGYSACSAGKKVSQIQAVLARRCAVVGELQQHLWRANWQKGVAEWGMLGGGVGGEWTSVVGEFGGMEAPSSDSFSGGDASSSKKKRALPRTDSVKIFDRPSFVGTNVSNTPGGSIVVDREALTAWSIATMRAVRDHLYMAAGSGAGELPFVEHWPREKGHFRDGIDYGGDAFANELDLPLWARETMGAKPSDASHAAAAGDGAVDSANVTSDSNSSKVVISDLSKMSNEVSALLRTLTLTLEQQRLRRLRRLRPRSRLRRNWYVFAIGMPVGTYVLHKLTKERGGFHILKTCFAKIADIYRDHVSEPLNSIYQEIFTRSGRIEVTDRKARADAIESLKRMIRSWLEEYFPKMPLEEKMNRAETMDISLIEERFEESIKHIYELNSVVRMSLIEMQFIKKELLSALVAMDELMGSNEINMQVAAMTPAVILLVAIRRVFRLLFYAFLQVGKSKEEIYSSFRQTILDIERLLVMRNNPPPPPALLDHWGSTRTLKSNKTLEAINGHQHVQKSQTILSAEDLGMLLLHIHECRNILWQSRRRFRSDVLRNVAEDLAELAGERGPVSVSQQLQIITRMARTYPFMKVVSSGIPFDMMIPGAGER